MSDSSSHDVTPVPSEEREESFFSFRTLTFALIILAIVLPIRFFIAKPFVVSGTSMYPTFNTWHYLIIDQLSYRFNEPARGDVIVFRFPQNPSRFFIKRIIGLPSETVIIEGTTVTIQNTNNPDGFTLDEAYIDPEYQKESQMNVVLGDNEYFVLGDNRKDSADSRYWGPLERDRIVGRAFVRLFPFTEISIFPGAVTYPALSLSGDTQTGLNESSESDTDI